MTRTCRDWPAPASTSRRHSGISATSASRLRPANCITERRTAPTHIVVRARRERDMLRIEVEDYCCKPRQCGGGGEADGERRFTSAGHIFQQHVALAQQRHQQQLDDRLLADDHAGDICAHLLRRRANSGRASVSAATAAS